MNKLTANQILEIIEKVWSISSYAFNEFDDVRSNNIEEVVDDYEECPTDPIIILKNQFIDKKEEILRTREEDIEKFLIDIGLGEIQEIEQIGGEGEGENWYTVKYFPAHNIYIKTRGTYYSYDGTHFDYGYGHEVFPKEKTITVYEK